MKTLSKMLFLLFLSLTAAAQVTVTCPQLPCDIHVIAPAPPVCTPPNVLVNGVCSVPVPPPVSTKFKIGDRVVVKGTTGSVSVRSIASATGTLLGGQAEGKLGTVVALAQKDTVAGGDAGIRWNVDYDAGVDGWSLEAYLAPYVIAPPVLHANLTWAASTSVVAGYNVYRGTVSGGPYSLVNTSVITTLSFKDPSNVSGTFVYVVRAVDSKGTESVNSNEVIAVLP